MGSAVQHQMWQCASYVLCVFCHPAPCACSSLAPRTFWAPHRPTSCACLAPQADTNLGKFLDYCTYGHMIDNVILIVTGTLHERDVQACSLCILLLTTKCFCTCFRGSRHFPLIAHLIKAGEVLPSAAIGEFKNFRYPPGAMKAA